MTSLHGRVRRRRLLAAVSASVALLSGCAGADSDGDEANGEGTGGGDTDDGVQETTDDARTSSDGAGSTAPPEDSDGSEGSTASEELDLREANVVDVAFTRDGTSYHFDVTLYHDDDGEAGYANWWQVETLDGDRLGRRDLLHAHSTAPFTRSATITVPEATQYVVVRGHDQTHGYGGQAMVVNVETGGTEAVEQGAEPMAFDDYEPGV